MATEEQSTAAGCVVEGEGAAPLRGEVGGFPVRHQKRDVSPAARREREPVLREGEQPRRSIRGPDVAIDRPFAIYCSFAAGGGAEECTPFVRVRRQCAEGPPRLLDASPHLPKRVDDPVRRVRGGSDCSDHSWHDTPCRW